MAVEEADADERDAEVARRLEVVAGEHAETARVLRQRFGDAELGREVGDLAQRRAVLGLEPQRGVEVALQLVVDVAEEPHERRVLGERLEPLPATPARAARTGSWTVASQASGSTHRNRSRVWASHDQRRFMARSSRAASSSGSLGRMVKLRSACMAVTVDAARGSISGHEVRSRTLHELADLASTSRRAIAHLSREIADLEAAVTVRGAP